MSHHIDNILLSNEYDIWRHSTVRDILAYVKCLINPFDQLNFQRVIRFPQRKEYTAVELASMRAEALTRGDRLINVVRERYPDDLFFGFETHISINLGACDTVYNCDPLSLVKSVVGWLDLPKHLSERALRTRMDIIVRLYNYIEYWIRNNDGPHGIKAFLDHLVFKDMQERLIREESNIMVMTVHGAKGLEFDHVIIPSLIEGYFPSKRSDVQEERRLFYVAITRAKELVYLLHYDQSATLARLGKKGTCKPSRFLDEI